jgi:hypothetical protein
VRLSASVVGVFRLAVAMNGTRTYNSHPRRESMKQVKKTGYIGKSWSSKGTIRRQEPPQNRSSTAVERL